MLNLSLEDLASNHPLLWLSQLLPAIVVDSLDLSLNRSNSNSNSSQQVVYSDHNQNLRGRDCLGQRLRASHNHRDSKEEEDCLGRVQERERERQVLEEGCLDQRRSSNSLRLEVDCLEVRRGRRGRVREDCLDSRTKSSQNLQEGCLEVLLLRLRLRLPLAVVDFLDRLCNSLNNSSRKEVSLGRLRSLLRLAGCLDQPLNNRSSSKEEGCLGTLDSHKPSLRVVCLAVAHLALHNNNNNNNNHNHNYNSNRKAACSDLLLASLRIRLASFSNPRLLSRVCSRACLV